LVGERVHDWVKLKAEMKDACLVALKVVLMDVWKVATKVMSWVDWMVVYWGDWLVGERVHDWVKLKAEMKDACWVALKVVLMDAWKAVTMDAD